MPAWLSPKTHDLPGGTQWIKSLSACPNGHNAFRAKHSFELFSLRFLCFEKIKARDNTPNVCLPLINIASLLKFVGYYWTPNLTFSTSYKSNTICKSVIIPFYISKVYHKRHGLLYFSIFLLFNYIWHTYYISFRCTAYWLDIYITYEVMPAISLVPTWHHTYSSQYDWLYSLCCTLHPLWLFRNHQFLLLNLFPFFTQPLSSHPIWQTSVYPLYHEFVSILFVHLFCVLDSTCKWNHMTFVFLCLMYFTMHSTL